MKNKQKGFMGVAIAIIVALILGGGGTYYYNKSKGIDKNLITEEDTAQDNVINTYNINTNISQNNKIVKTSNTASKCGFEITNIKANSEVKFPLKIEGIIDNTNYKKVGCSWGMFEGTAGTAQLFYNENNTGWKTIGSGIPVFVKEWTTLKTTFSVILGNDQMALPYGTPMKIVFTEENPSGKSDVDTYEFFVKTKNELKNY